MKKETASGETPAVSMGQERRQTKIIDLDKRLDRYNRAYERIRQVSEFLPDQYRVRANSCGSQIWFRHWVMTGNMALGGGIFCQLHLLCPFCALRRGVRLVNAYLDRYERLLGRGPAVALNFTIKNGPNLLERVAHILGAHRELLRRRRESLRVKDSSTEYRKVQGGVYSLEVKRGAGSGEWHPHLHTVVILKDWLDLDVLSREWEEITGDSRIIYASRIEKFGDAVKGFLEVFKYALKFQGLPIKDNLEAWRLLRGRRLVGSYGCFRGLPEIEGLGDDLTEKGPYEDLLYRYIVGQGLDHVGTIWGCSATDKMLK